MIGERLVKILDRQAQQGQAVHRAEAAGRSIGQKLFGLRDGPDAGRGPLGVGGLGQVGHVARHQAPFISLPQGLVQHGMQILDCAPG